MTNRRIFCCCAALTATAGLLWQKTRIFQLMGTVAQRLLGQKTVTDRVSQYGEAARQRLKPHFKASGIAYPPSRIIFVGLKQEEILQVWAANQDSSPKLIRSYPIIAASGGPGPKLREGDCQVPEGLYKIESLNPNSSYHLSLRINYPNKFDRDQAEKENRTNLGGDIMIHGSSSSVGCLAMDNQPAEDLFILAADTKIKNIKVILTPKDFRVNPQPTNTQNLPPWTKKLYNDIIQELRQLK